MSCRPLDAPVWTWSAEAEVGVSCLQVQPLMGSGFGYCSMASANKTGNVDAALPPTAGGLASLSQYNVLPRSTIINEQCRLPVVYGSACAAPLTPLLARSRTCQ